MNTEKGIFWVPENPSRKIAGYLAWDQDHISLDLIGALEDHASSSLIGKYLIINGLLGQKPVILYDNFETNRSFHFGAQDYTALNVGIIFFGVNATNSDPLYFHKCVFEPTYYDQWVNKKDSVDIEFPNPNEKYKTTIKYELPDPIITILPNRHQCKISFGVTGPSVGFHRKDILLKQSTGFVYESKRKIEIKKLLRIISHYSKLVMLFTQSPTFMENVKVYYRLPHSKDFIKADMHWTSRSHPDLKEPSPFDFLLYYSHIAKYYDSILKKWYLSVDLVNTALNSYFETFFSRSNLEEYALNILKSMESYHRDQIGPRNRYLLSRYKDLFERARPAFNPFLRIHSKQKFCEKLKSLRHDLAHNNPMSINRHKYGQRLHVLATQARLILTCNILLDLGIPMNVIKNGVDKSSAYSSIKKPSNVLRLRN